MYAIIATGGKQYKVSEGDIITIEKLPENVGDTVTFNEVLVVGGDHFKTGEPTIAGASVEGNVLRNGRGKKIMVYKYKPKKGFHKKIGHRQSFTTVKISKINAG